jgi:hypothetical protein
MKTVSKELEKFLVDLSHEYKKEVMSIIEKESPKNRQLTDMILAKFRRDKGFLKVGKFTTTYWEQRGWSKEDALTKREENRVNNIPQGSPMQVKYWEKRINPKTDNNYTREESEYKIRSQRKFNIEYWIERGLTKDESILKIKDIQKENSAKRKKYHGVTWNQFEYWMKKEKITEEEAKKKVSELQKTFDLEKIIKRYGKIEGTIRYENMCKNLSNSQSLNGFINRYGIDEGNKKYIETIIKRCSNTYTSKESLILFKKIYKKIRKYLQRNEIYWGISGSKEYFLYNKDSKKVFFYDFTIPRLKIIIEYHGKRYHPNPKWDQEKWNKWNFMGLNAKEKRDIDVYKNKVAENYGFEVIEIFSDEVNESTIELIINKIIQKNNYF